MRVSVKGVREAAARTDGTRVLVDRRWPRGISKDAAKLDAWLRGLAPSEELCAWFKERPTQWPNFRERYLEELTAAEAEAALEELHDLAERKASITLLTSVADREHSAATVLAELLSGKPKPPRTTGPIKEGAVRKRAAARR